MNDLATGSLPDFKLAAIVSMPLRPNEVARAVEVYAHAEGLPVMLASALVRSESGFNPAVSNKGALGLMQIKLITARKVGYEGDEAGLLDPLTNLEYGMRHLAQIYRMTNRDICRTIAVYRSGNPQARPTAEQMALCAKSRG
jgi:soluble lytic murein transglycosylase-like protein